VTSLARLKYIGMFVTGVEPASRAGPRITTAMSQKAQVGVETIIGEGELNSNVDECQFITLIISGWKVSPCFQVH
jgi:hypothetical protein